jgi:zinc protease
MQHIIHSSKYIMGAVILQILCTGAFSQSSGAYETTVSGVKVIVQPSGNEIVEITTVIKGGVQNYPANKEGIENLAINALTECGTVKDDKNSFKDKLDKVSAQIDGSTGMDYASFTMNCIKSDFDVVWPLYVDALTTPRFDPKEFDRMKQDAVNNLKIQSSGPDYSIAKLARQTAFAGTDYAKTPSGSESSINRLTVAETQAYYKSILTRSRLLIVVVGEIDRPVLEQKITAMMAAIPEGKPVVLKKMAYSPTKNSFVSQKKELATNYIEGVTSGPDPLSPDFNAFTIANKIFYDRHFLEVRTNNGLSYAPQTRFNGGLGSYTAVMVSTKNPDKYISVLDQLVTKTKQEGFTPDEVRDTKTTYLTYYYYGLETNESQASSLASNEVVHNNWRRALTLSDDLKKVSQEDVNKAFDKYITHMTWVYQGDSTKVTPALYTADSGPKQKLPPSTLKKDKSN